MKEKNVLLIGNFDGVHLGHQMLITKAREIANDKNEKLIALTFRPHPREIINKSKINLLLPYNEKISMLKNYGVDIVDELDFTDVLSKIDAVDFAKEYIIKKHNPSDIVIGDNFKFGHKAQGDALLLKSQFNNIFKTHNLSIKKIDNLSISSSIIKDLLLNGNISTVNNLLGRYYHLRGKVIKGEQRGRMIGFPTTNLGTDWEFLPKKGVYVTIVTIDKVEFQSITNIGIRPTFDSDSLQIESHIFNFDQDVYEKEIKIDFLERIRDEKKFETVDKLIENITKDVNFGKNYFKDLK